MLSSKSMTFVYVSLFLTVMLVTACDTALVMSGHTVGIQSGRFIYTDGSLSTQYHAPLDRVWNACEETLKDMKATDIEKQRKIAGGTLTAVIQEEKVVITVEYDTKDDTDVSILIGVSGNNLASQLIHQKIAKALEKP
jgi:hypothetical protein